MGLATSLRVAEEIPDGEGPSTIFTVGNGIALRLNYCLWG
jgi:hypothetical protein